MRARAQAHRCPLPSRALSPTPLAPQVAFQGFIHMPAKMLHAVINDGVRPTFPEGTPEWYSSLAARCWAAAPKHRPSFRRIAAILAAVPPEQLVWGAPAAVAAALPSAPGSPSAVAGLAGGQGGGEWQRRQPPVAAQSFGSSARSTSSGAREGPLPSPGGGRAAGGGRHHC
jgi:hypothetical protein